MVSSDGAFGLNQAWMRSWGWSPQTESAPLWGILGNPGGKIRT